MAKKASRKKTTGGRKSPAKRSAKKTTARSAKKTARRSAKKTTKRTASAAKRPAKRTAKKTARRVAKKAAPRKRASAGRGRAARGSQTSPSTVRARWVESLEDRAQTPGETLATRSHEVIQRWAEERGAVPATVGSEEGDEIRVLRLNFPGFGGESLREVGWDDWFRTFDDRDLVFLFEESLKDGNQSNFFRLDNPREES